MARRPLTEVIPYVNHCETSSSETLQKIRCFEEKLVVGGGFFHNSVTRRKEEAMSSFGLDTESLEDMA